MPWQKFEALYESHCKRQAVEAAERIRNSQIAGVWANTNLDSQKEGQESPREGVLKEIYKSYVDSIKKIYNQFEEKDSDEINWDDPFFKPMKVPSNPYYKPDTTSPVPHDQNLEINIDQE